MAMATGKRRRVVHLPPSKNGCRTCRVRRVKCDEGKPHCYRCTSTGRICDGYEALPSPPEKASRRRQLLPIQGNDDGVEVPTFMDRQLIRHSGFTVNEYERHFYNHFRIMSGNAIAEISPTTRQWTELALQLSLEEETVFQAITAIGGVSDAHLQIGHHTLTRPISVEKETLAVQQYCKASALLRNYIHNAMVSGGRLEPVLVCCFLFICFEVIQERGNVALAHLQFGQRVVAHCMNDDEDPATPNRLKPQSPAMTQFLFASLKSFLGNVAENAAQSDPVSPVPVTFEDDLKGQAVSLPTAFMSIEEAKAYLAELVERSKQLRKELTRVAEEHITAMGYSSLSLSVHFVLSQCISRCVPLTHCRELASELEHLTQQHETWLTLLSEHQHREQDPKTSRYFALLRIQHFESYFLLATCRKTREEYTDTFADDFERILQLSEDYITAVDLAKTNDEITNKNQKTPSETLVPRQPISDIPTRRNNNNHHQSFSLETHLLPTLNLIAMKCRIPTIRTRTLDLLSRIDRQEGRYWSRIMAHHTSKIAFMEEQRAAEQQQQHVNTSDETLSLSTGAEEIIPPEAARFADVVHVGADAFQDARVLCARFRHEEEGAEEVEIIEYRHLLNSLALEPITQITWPHGCVTVE